MAPFFTVTLQVFQGLLGLGQQGSVQKPVGGFHVSTTESVIKPPGVSAVSWGLNRIDIFGGAKGTGGLAHKFWDGYGWKPAPDEFEVLGEGFLSERDVPASTSWGLNRLDLFARDSTNASLLHKYWDGFAWKPSANTYESLGGSLKLDSDLAVTSWGVGRLDIFAIDGAHSNLAHKYFDGSSWKPAKGTEDLGGDLVSGVSAVSWGSNRLDIVGIDKHDHLVHLYYDGTKWSGWEDTKFPEKPGIPKIISWGANRLDIFTTSKDTKGRYGGLFHRAWDGSRWLDWELLGGTGDVALLDPVAAVSWSSNRMDIVALDTKGDYYYKFWDGYGWRPGPADEGATQSLYKKGGGFASIPAVSSWGPNRLDIFGVTASSELAHQTWYGTGWYPEWEFEKLGGSWR